MKAIIEVNTQNNLSSILIKKGNKTVNWTDLTREEQIKITNAFSAYFDLYRKFIK